MTIFRDTTNGFLLDQIIVPEEIIIRINIANKIAIIGHVEPDGDSIGAQLALYEALNLNGWKVDVINEGPFEGKFFKKNKKIFKNSIKDQYDIFIILDTPSIDRIGSLSVKIDFENSIIIDHHFTNTKFGKINWIDDSFLSTSEMIFLLLKKMNIGLNNKNICQNLLNGIISDSGFFLHVRQNLHYSLLIGFYLIEIGADPKLSYKLLFGGKNLSSKKLVALVIQRIESFAKDRILWTYINDEDKKKYKNPILDSTDVFKEMLTIEGVDIAIFFKISKNKISISFRSNDRVDVASLARELGGGGHRSASGVTMEGKFLDIKDKILKKASEYLN